MDERKFVGDFPYPSDVVARELLRKIDETFDQSPYLFILCTPSLRAQQLRRETIPDDEDWLLTGERDANGAWIVDDDKLSAYQRKARYEIGDEYDFGAIRTFTVRAHRRADRKNPETLEDPQAVRCEIMPRADGATTVVLRCDAPPEVEDDGLDEHECRDLAAQRAHCEAAVRYCDLLLAKMQETLGAELQQTTLPESEPSELAGLLDALETRTFPADELGRHLAAIQMALAEISIRAEQIGDRQLVESARQVTELASAPGLDIKHKLKVTIPIVPVLLSYEGAFELGSRLNLEAAWRALRGWITGG